MTPFRYIIDTMRQAFQGVYGGERDTSQPLVPEMTPISLASRSRMALLSRWDRSSIWLVKPGFTNRHFFLVMGWTRTTGRTATSRLSSIRLDRALSPSARALLLRCSALAQLSTSCADSLQAALPGELGDLVCLDLVQPGVGA